MERLLKTEEVFSHFTNIDRNIAKSKSELFEIFRSIKNERVSRKYTQEDLAKKSGIPRSSISKIENGYRNTTILTLIKVAASLDKVLSVSLEDNGYEEYEEVFSTGKHLLEYPEIPSVKTKDKGGFDKLEAPAYSWSERTIKNQI